MIDPERLRELTSPEWTSAREDTILRRLQQAPERRRGSWAAATLAVAAVALLAFFTGHYLRAPEAPSEPTIATAQTVRPLASAPSETTRPGPAPATTPSPLQFIDGSSVRPHDDTSDVVIANADARLTRVELRHGGAHFDVTPNDKRRFVVEIGLVTVEVLGTEFDVDRQLDHVTVAVLRGHVSVSWPGGERVLARGDSGIFPPPEAKLLPAKRTSHSPRAAPGWRHLAHEGRKHEAYEAIKSGAKVRNHAEELMLAADVARGAGAREAALVFLHRVVDEHASGPRAPLAAFTIGRIELGRGHNEEAARHFAMARELGGNTLAEHALAREVEAWVAAGRPDKARTSALEYFKRFPKGSRVEQVRQISGVNGR